MITDPDKLAEIDAICATFRLPDCHFPVRKGNGIVLAVFNRQRFMQCVDAGDRIPTAEGGYVERTVSLAEATGWDQWSYVPPPAPPELVEPLPKRLGRAVGQIARRIARRR